MLVQAFLFAVWYNILLPAFLAFVFVLLLLASFGKTLGMRSKYAQLLLRVFEYGRQKIEKAERRNRILEDDISSEEDQPKEKMANGLSNSVISREGVQLFPEPPKNREGFLPRNRSFNTLKREFLMDDVMDFIKAGVESIIEDEVTQRFAAEELVSWNLLTRTNKNYQYISMRLTIIWCVGFFLRYFILLPARVLIMVIGINWMVFSTALLSLLPRRLKKLKMWLYCHISLMGFRIMGRSFSAIVTYHNQENRAKGGGICVANHTSPIDCVLLSSDNCYALVGQIQGGLLGILQRALGRAAHHVFFERSEIRDRAAVTRRLREHVEDPNKLPILLFPEGTCINNTSVMMFKKGSFEVGGVIYPAAIKYDAKFGDPFWNSSRQGMIHYLLMMMSSWAIVCDIWYLPPMTRRENETAVEFANRVKSEIARQGGLVDLMWDGQLKRMQVKKEWKERQQEEYSKMIKVD